MWGTKHTHMKKTHFLLLAVLLLAACSGKKAPNAYSVSGTLPDNVTAEWVYLYSIEGEEPVAIDSARVKNGAFRIEGIVPDTSTVLYLHPGSVDEYPAFSWNLIPEPADLVADSNDQFVSGGPLNDGLHSWMQQLMGIFSTGDESGLSDFFRNHWSEHSGDFVGAYILTSVWSMLDFDLADSLAQTIPDNLQQLHFVKSNLMDPIKSTREMQPGNPFKDFDLTTLDGQDTHFSDFVGKGDYVLVDFWASWCGPCRQAIPELQSIVKKYKKLKVIGIAINDRPEETQRAIDNLSITWPVFTDSKVASGRIYGFNAIPFMMLFAPDGTIVARGFHTDTLDELLSANLK